MELELMNMISNASINGYYDPSLNMIVVWFHNIKEKPDLVAYLENDMQWDLREILEEKSVLHNDKEIIEISHKNIGKFSKDGDFDKTVRSVLNQIIDNSLEDSSDPKVEMMKIVLDTNSYYGVNN